MTQTRLAAADAAAGQRGRTGLRRLLASLGFAAATFSGLGNGAGIVLVPLQVEHLDKAHKVVLLGVVSGVGAVFGLVGNPVGGALSDRTRSRFGRRAPWLVLGSLTSLVLLGLLGLASSVLLVVVIVCLFSGVNALYQAPLTAVIPDRVPISRRGVASAVWGICTIVGTVIGVGIAGLLGSHLEAGYLVLGGLLVLATAWFVLRTRDPSTADLPPPPADTRPLHVRLGMFLSALRHRDFALVFASRLSAILGYSLVASYDLYILTDYIKTPHGMTPARGVTVIAAIAAVGALLSAAICGPLSDRLNRRKPFVFISSVVAGAGSLVPVFWPSWGTLEIFAAFAGVALGCYLSVDAALVTLVLPRSENAARDLGVLNIATNGPQVVAPLLAALIITNAGGYPPLFLIGGACAVAGAFFVLGVRSVR